MTTYTSDTPGALSLVLTPITFRPSANITTILDPALTITATAKHHAALVATAATTINATSASGVEKIEAIWTTATAGKTRVQVIGTKAGGIPFFFFNDDVIVPVRNLTA